MDAPPSFEALRDQAERVLMKAQKIGWTMATAESCTGGLIASLLTDIPGASAVFRGGWVTYTDGIKMEALGVPPTTIAAFGAVSEAVARALAEGARERASAEVAVSTTGILGPSGATPAKPLGLVWIAVATSGATQARSFRHDGDRLANKRAFAGHALDLVEAILDQDES